MSELPKSAEAFKNITEAAENLKVPAYVLRFWEAKFPQISPLKLGGRRRYYSPEDIELLHSIKILLYKEGYTIKGVQKLVDDKGVGGLVQMTKSQERDFSIELPDDTVELEAILADIESIEDKLKKVL